MRINVHESEWRGSISAKRANVSIRQSRIIHVYWISREGTSVSQLASQSTDSSTCHNCHRSHAHMHIQPTERHIHITISIYPFVRFSSWPTRRVAVQPKEMMPCTSWRVIAMPIDIRLAKQFQPLNKGALNFRVCCSLIPSINLTECNIIFVLLYVYSFFFF